MGVYKAGNSCSKEHGGCAQNTGQAQLDIPGWIQGQPSILGPRQTWHYCLEGLRETTARRDGVSVVIQIVELLLLQVAVICVLFSHSKYVTVPKLLLFRSQQRYWEHTVPFCTKTAAIPSLQFLGEYFFINSNYGNKLSRVQIFKKYITGKIVNLLVNHLFFFPTIPTGFKT